MFAPTVPAGTAEADGHMPQALARADALATLGTDPFDLVIIGGGITGAGVAREAALAGWRVALIERDDFASGTSSRSSRLVHGGVRYLEHGHLSLVFESSRERRLLLSLAPHLVRPLAFTWPVYRGARVPLWKVRAGLTLYDALALFRNVHGHSALRPDGVLAIEPALERTGLVGGARYWDAATDDARLTLASALAAREAGAVVVNHATVVAGLHRTPGSQLEGVRVVDRLTSAQIEVRAPVIVNATGPWSDATAALTGTPSGTQLLGSAGAHLSVPRHRVGNNDAITIVSPLDGRVMFVLPAGAHTIIGTTEHPARSGPDEIRATELDVQYLLRSVNVLFPNANLTGDDVIAAWAGIRPLAAARAGEHSANTASREHAIARRSDGLLSVTGGKLTTYRAMAADVFAAAQREYPSTGGTSPITRLRTERSDHAVLPGGSFQSRETLMAEIRQVVHDPAVVERLALAYGSRWPSVWAFATRDAALARRIVDDLPYLTAEVAHAIVHELACTLSDILIRRTHIAFETRDHGRATARRIAPMVATLLGWTDTEQAQRLAEYDADVARLFAVDPV